MSNAADTAVYDPLTRSKLKTSITRIASAITDRTLKSSLLACELRDVFGGTDAAGAWTWRMAYDVMQAAALVAVRNAAPNTADPQALQAIAIALLTETRRSEAQIRLQQFSTPLPYAALVVRAGQIRTGDLVLEPSAGTGNIAALASAAGATLLLNEIDPFRRMLLETIFACDVHSHDGAHIDDLLTDYRTPDVVLMNPPFSSSVDRANDPHIAAKHLIGAAKRLAPGGRLVAIMPMSFAQTRDAGHWKRASALMTPRLTLAIPGTIYRKLGTNVDTQLVVFDKVHDDRPMQAATAADLRQAAEIIDGLAPRGEIVAAAPLASLVGKVPEPRLSAPQAASKPLPARAGGKHALVPLDFDVLDIPRTNAPVSEIYARYAPQRMLIKNAQPHPTPLVESIAMASVAPPMATKSAATALKLPGRLIQEGILSEAQLETIIMANDAHARDLPGKFTINDDQTQLLRQDDQDDANAYRRGFFLGDGTGCGKGRECAGLIMVNWIAGRRKAVWISKSATLIEDAVRDWTDLGGSPAGIQNLSKWKPDQAITMGDGIMFVTYATLRSAAKDGTTRLSQLLDWLGDAFDGVIAFDEAHAMQNAAGTQGGRGAKPSQQGLAGLRLQLATPRARVLYVSATGATSVQNLAYAPRLGLWGQGQEYPFPTRESFVAAMEAGGVAAMEVVARDLKTLGLYTARALSFDGVEYDILEHGLTDAQIEIYDAYASAFKTIHQNLEAALMATGVVGADGKTNASAARAASRSRFESTKQRFFNHILMGMKAPAIIDAIQADIADGWACVVQIVSTGESLLKRRLDTMDTEDELVEGALTPRDYVIAYLEAAFPIHAQKLVEIDGNIVAEPLRDAEGRMVVSREALQLRDDAMDELMTLAAIPAALDQIIWAFGTDEVAEVTGRSIRPVKADTGAIFIENRTASANSAETTDFMAGRKDILIFSDAGGTGRSYHAAQSAANQKRRRHYLVEPGWRADAAIQGLGRTHRSAQVSAPFFRVCTSNVHGEKRFTATIARRLDNLGALTKGQRETGSQGMFREEDNLESPIARQALRGLYGDLARGSANAMSYETFTEWTALKLTDQEGVMLEELPPIQRFLNRVLALPIHLQNALFEEFMERIANQTERARAAGTLDIGIETLRGDRIVQTSVDDMWTCPTTGAVTRIVGLEVTHTIHITTGEEVTQFKSDKQFMINCASNRVAKIDKRPFQSYDEDTVSLLRVVVRPTGRTYVTEDKFEKSAWEIIGKKDFIRLWDDEASKLPTTSTDVMYVLTGLLIPIWKQIPSNNERIYRVEPEGQPAMIGRTLSADGAAALRARFMIQTPKTVQDMVTVALSTTEHVDLGQGLTLARRRVANEVRLEISGADRAALPGLKAMGCFTEIIAFQLRLFVPHGKDVDTAGILAKITGQQTGCAPQAA